MAGGQMGAVGDRLADGLRPGHAGDEGFSTPLGLTSPTCRSWRTRAAEPNGRVWNLGLFNKKAIVSRLVFDGLLESADPDRAVLKATASIRPTSPRH